MWTIAKHEINSDYGFYPAKRWIHALKYEHERSCAEVFTKFAQAEIHGWEQHKKILGTGIVPDRTVWLTETLPLYIEVEKQTGDRVSEKLSGYQSYYRETNNPFLVLFLVQRLRDWRSSTHYDFQLLDDFLSKPLSKPYSMQR